MIILNEHITWRSFSVAQVMRANLLRNIFIKCFEVSKPTALQPEAR
jgi:hypothetical protein